MSKNIVKFLYFILFFFTPLIFSSQNSELFELPKMYFVYSITLLILIFHFYNYFRGFAPLFNRSFLDLPLLLFLGSQIISTIFSIDLHTSVFGYYSRLNGGLISLICYALLYWILVVYIDNKHKDNIINISLMSGFLVAVYGVAQHFGIDKHIWVQDVQSRVFSTLGQPNWLAAYLCILIPFAVDKIILQNRLVAKLYFSAITSTLFLALLYTKSKSGIIALIISLGIYFIFKFLSDIKDRSLFANRKSYLVILIFIILSFATSNPIRDFILPPQTSNLSLKTDNSTLNITPSEDIRKIVWQGSFKLWQQFPLFGTGPETFAYSYYWTRASSHNLTSEWDFLYNKAHNEYLNYLATTGSLGLLTYLFLITIVLYSLHKSNYDQKNALFAAYTSILITNITGFSVVIISVYFFLLPSLLHPTESKSLKNPNNASKTMIIVLMIMSAYIFLKNINFYLADLTYAAAETLDNNQEYSKALSQIKLSANYRPGEPVYQIKLANILAKMALSAKNQQLNDLSLDYTDQAIIAANKATSISPFNVNFWKEKAQIYYYLSVINTDYYLQAIDSLTKVTLLAPTDARSFYMLAEFYRNIKEYDQSIKYYQRAIELKSNYDHAYFALGKIYFEQKKFDQAKPLFESTLKYAPGNLDAKDYLNQIATAASVRKK